MVNMISKKDLKAYGFGDMINYYFYIESSNTNGNFSQVRDLIKEMSNKQYIEFIKYLTSENKPILDIYLSHHIRF
jgi:hypothetical protein